MARRGGMGREFGLYPSNTTLGWSIIRGVSFEKGESKVALGVWRRVNDELGNHIGYQMLASAVARGDLDLASRPQPVAITMRQMEMNAFQVFADGRSRTIGAREEHRMERVAQGFEPEDEIERVHRKVQVFRKITAAKQDILRLWPRGADEPLAALI